MSAISLRNVWKEFDGRIVLESLSADIAAGSFVAVVGPSGCGKTTLLRMILAEDRPTRGEILIDGAPLPDEPTEDRGIVYQRYSVFPHLTALGNVMLGPKFMSRRKPAAKSAIRDRAHALLQAVGLSEACDLYPAQMSGGMQQRLALAQALIMRPKILLLDEPFGALDPGTTAEMHALMRALWRETGVTVLLVTHDLGEAFGLATRVIALERPRDRPEERERYGAIITKDFDVWPRGLEWRAAQSSRER